jgi:hypothetical protein
MTQRSQSVIIRFMNTLIPTKTRKLTPKEYLNSDISKIKESRFQIDFDKLGDYGSFNVEYEDYLLVEDDK